MWRGVSVRAAWFSGWFVRAWGCHDTTNLPVPCKVRRLHFARRLLPHRSWWQRCADPSGRAGHPWSVGHWLARLGHSLLVLPFGRSVLSQLARRNFGCTGLASLGAVQSLASSLVVAGLDCRGRSRHGLSVSGWLVFPFCLARGILWRLLLLAPRGKKIDFRISTTIQICF